MLRIRTLAVAVAAAAIVVGACGGGTSACARVPGGDG